MLQIGDRVLVWNFAQARACGSMKRKWKSHLSMLGKIPERGERILVWTGGRLVHARVQKVRRGEIEYSWRWGAVDQFQSRGHVRRRLEHVEWVRESADDDNARAFIAAKALEHT